MPADDAKLQLQSPITRTQVVIRVKLRNGSWYEHMCPPSSAFDTGMRGMPRKTAATIVLRQGLALLRELEYEHLNGGMYGHDGQLHDIQSEVVFLRVHAVCYTVYGARRTAWCEKRIKAIDYSPERVIATGQACLQRVVDTFCGGNYDNSDAQPGAYKPN